MVRYKGSAVVAGCVHATTLMKLALVDSVNHTLKKLSSLFAAVAVDDTHLQTFRKEPASVAPASACFITEHAEEVVVFVVSSRKLEILTNDEMIRTDVRMHAEALCTCTRNMEVDHACGGKRTGAKVIAMRAERSRVKMTSLQRRQDRCRLLFDLWC